MHRLRVLVLAAVLIAALLPAVPAAAALRDLNNHWSRRQVELAIQWGWVKGYPDGTFKPNQAVKNGEFLGLLTRVLGLPAAPAGTPLFPGVKSGHWAAPGAQSVAARGYILPADYPGGLNLDDAISRLQIARIAGRILPAAEATATFTDAAGLAPADGAAIGQAAAWGIFTGDPGGTFRPLAAISRAEAVVVLLRLYQVVMVPEKLATPDAVFLGDGGVTPERLAAYSQAYSADVRPELARDFAALAAAQRKPFILVAGTPEAHMRWLTRYYPGSRAPAGMGEYYDVAGVVLLGEWQNDLRGVNAVLMSHEVTHWLVDAVLGGDPPVGLDESVAYIESWRTWHRTPTWTSSLAARYWHRFLADSGPIPAEPWKTRQPQPADVAATDYLVARYGLPALSQYITLTGSMPHAAAFQSAFGVSLSGFREQFVQEVTRRRQATDGHGLITVHVPVTSTILMGLFSNGQPRQYTSLDPGAYTFRVQAGVAPVLVSPAVPEVDDAPVALPVSEEGVVGTFGVFFEDGSEAALYVEVYWAGGDVYVPTVQTILSMSGEEVPMPDGFFFSLGQP